jgi:hypothetical protein
MRADSHSIDCITETIFVRESEPAVLASVAPFATSWMDAVAYAHRTVQGHGSKLVAAAAMNAKSSLAVTQLH